MKHTRNIIELFAAVLIGLSRHLSVARFTKPKRQRPDRQAVQMKRAAAEVGRRIGELVEGGRLSPIAADQLRALLLDPALPARIRAAWLLPTCQDQPPVAARLCDLLQANAPATIGEQSSCQTNAEVLPDSGDDTLLLMSPLSGGASVTSQMIERANAAVGSNEQPTRA